MIYFILDAFSGAVKIGQCWGDKGPGQALRNAQGGNPRQLLMVAVLSHIPLYGAIEDEPDLSIGWVKAKFRKEKIRNSWFKSEPVLQWLNGHCARRFMIPDYNMLPQAKRYRRVR